MNTDQSLSFEVAIRELEDIVRKLESGNIELEKAIELYSRGAELRTICDQKLKEAKLKVEQIVEKEGVVAQTVPFDS